MKRKTGYYWVMYKHGSPWELVYFDEYGFWVSSPNNRLDETQLYRIDERRVTRRSMTRDLIDFAVFLGFLALLGSLLKHCA